MLTSSGSLLCQRRNCMWTLQFTTRLLIKLDRIWPWYQVSDVLNYNLKALIPLRWKLMERLECSCFWSISLLNVQGCWMIHMVVFYISIQSYYSITAITDKELRRNHKIIIQHNGAPGHIESKDAEFVAAATILVTGLWHISLKMQRNIVDRHRCACWFIFLWSFKGSTVTTTTQAYTICDGQI